MPDSRTATALTRIGVLYLVALLGVVGGLIVSPFSIPLLMALLALILLFFAVALVTFGFASVLIAVMVLDLVIPGFKTYINSRLRSSRLNRGPGDDETAGLLLSTEKLKQFCPELFAEGNGFRNWLADRFGSKAAVRQMIADHLKHGDRRAAVVVSLIPLRIAAYADKLDAVALLRFPDEFVKEYGLRVFGRLVSVNRCFRDVAVAADLDLGRLSGNECANFRPVIADFFCDEAEEIRTLRTSIREDEWRRATYLGRQYLERHGDQARDGHPLRSLTPAKVVTPPTENRESSL